MLQIVSLIRTLGSPKEPGCVFLVWRLGTDTGAIAAPSIGEAAPKLRERFGAARCRAAAAALQHDLAREVELLCA